MWIRAAGEKHLLFMARLARSFESMKNWPSLTPSFSSHAGALPRRPALSGAVTEYGPVHGPCAQDKRGNFQRPGNAA